MSKYNSIAFYGNSVYKGVRVWHEFLVEDEKRPVLHLLGPWKLQKQTFFHVLSFFGYTNDITIVADTKLRTCIARGRVAPSANGTFLIEDYMGIESRTTHKGSVVSRLYAHSPLYQALVMPINVKKLSAGPFHVLFTTNEGNLYAHGSNTYGELGLGDGDARAFPVRVDVGNVTHVAAGAHYSVISYGECTFPTPPCIGVVGKNTSGQLGVRYNNLYLGRQHFQQHLAQPVFQNVFLTAHANVKQISTGWSHTLLLFEDGTVQASGLGFLGRLGLGDERDRRQFTKVVFQDAIEQVSAGETFSLFRSASETFFSGDNVLTPAVVDSGALAVYASHKRIISVKGDYSITEVVIEQLEQDEIEILSETLEKINL